MINQILSQIFDKNTLKSIEVRGICSVEIKIRVEYSHIATVELLSPTNNRSSKF